MKKVFTRRHKIILGLVPVSLLLIFLARKSVYFAEHIYAKHIYKLLSQLVSLITGLIPFSIAELIIAALPIIFILLIAFFIKKLIVDKENRKVIIARSFINILCCLSIILFSYTLMGGLNYYRYTFSTYSGLEIRQSSLEELYSLTRSLALEAGSYRDGISSVDENGVFVLSQSFSQLRRTAAKAYKILAEEYPILGGYYGAPKPVIMSKLMSTTETTGIFIPFTMEANVNIDIPDFTIPHTMLHEMAHLRGFMREDEANFLAYKAGMVSDSIEFKYSSTMHALIHAGNALYRKSPDLYFEIRDLYTEGMINDIRNHSQYWAQYDDTVISTVSNKINDTYLKANAQTDGVESYGRMLDLLLAEYRKKQGLSGE
ncbi:MAG: DUF3810 domain-containing protein [Clostridiales bacterium]|nr:DUF3810 domain-containing protein [Clostridiales bacterium]